MLEAAKVIPISGIKSEFPLKIPIEAINPPIESEPVSPMNTFAL